MLTYFKLITFAVIMLSSIQSCSFDTNRINNQVTSDNNSDSIQLIMHIEQEYNSVEMTEPLSDCKHEAFHSSQICSTINTNRIKGTAYDCVTMHSEHIPIWKYNSSNQSLYSNGTTEYTMEFRIIDNEEYNAILDIAGAIVDFDRIPSKATYSKGVMTLYGPKNNLLFQGDCPQPDLTEFKDTLEYYINICKEMNLSHNVKSSTTDINEIKQRMQKRGIDMSNATISFEGSNVVIQQQLNVATPQITSSGLLDFCSGPMYNRSILSSDLSKIYSTRVFLGEQLLSQSIYKYLSEANMHVNVSGTDFSIPLPSRIESMQLVMHNDTPMIHTKITSYTKNNITIYNIQ